MYSDIFTLNDLMFLLHGALVSIELAVMSLFFGTIAGVFVGWSRFQAGSTANQLLAALFEVFRSVPLLIQLILTNSLNFAIDLRLSPIAVSVVTLGLYATAFCAEIAYDAFEAVPKNTRRAARSLGMSYWQDLLFIVCPLALRVALPSWIGLALSVVKDTSLVLWIGVVELLRASQILTERFQQPLFILSLAGAIYFAISFPLARLGTWLEARWNADD